MAMIAVGGTVALTHHSKVDALKAESPICGSYIGHDKINVHYKDIDFYYSDGVFEGNPNIYDHQLATISMNLANASDNYVSNGDYSNGAKTIKSVYEQIGLRDEYVSYYYEHKPETDSIGYIIGSKDVHLNYKDKDVKLISITVRSAGYELEWASNVKLGKEGEAKGFHEAAQTVTDQVYCYLKDHNLDKEAKKGNLMFWVQGFSRGGATANIVAKNLVDIHQKNGNSVYGYTFEAPQGGVNSYERSDVDYRCIHNIINVNDLVPYVAPSKMGFKRYGTDHYLYGTDFDSMGNTFTNNQFPNNKADNKPATKPTDKEKELMEKQLAKLTSNISGNKLYEVKGYELNIKNFSIDEVEMKETTSAFIKKTIDGVSGAVSRKEFVDSGLEKALANLMAYLIPNKDCIAKFKDEFGWMDLVQVIKDMLLPLLYEDVVDIVDSIFDTIGVTTKTEGFTDGFKAELAKAIVERLRTKEKLIDELNNKYPGQSKQALKDIDTAIYYVLGGVKDIDETITLYKNIDGLIQNHSVLQAIAWLRSYDIWYEPKVVEPMW